MNSPREQFDSLLRAAAGRPVDFGSVPAYGLETRVLAAWRSSRGTPLLDTGVLVRGLAIAGLLMAVSIWPALERTSGNADSENLQLVDSSVQTDWTP
jgi:hypothetical protein